MAKHLLYVKNTGEKRVFETDEPWLAVALVKSLIENNIVNQDFLGNISKYIGIFENNIAKDYNVKIPNINDIICLSISITIDIVYCPINKNHIQEQKIVVKRNQDIIWNGSFDDIKSLTRFMEIFGDV